MIVAIHEAGHAVARVLSIGRAGITAENAIRWIDMTQGSPHCSVFSLPLGIPGVKEAGERAGIKEGGPEPTSKQWLTVLFPAMGIDPLEWARVQLFELAAGAAAQARFSGLPFAMVWYSNGCSDDRQSVWKSCQTIGLNEQEAVQLFKERSEDANVAMARPNVWRAVLTLAEQLPSTGRMPGSSAVAVVQRALNE
jgi:hypothetical protein